MENAEAESCQAEIPSYKPEQALSRLAEIRIWLGEENKTSFRGEIDFLNVLIVIWHMILPTSRENACIGKVNDYSMTYFISALHP